MARRFVALLALLLVLLPLARALAAPAIPPGQEPRVLALLEPYALGEEVTPGWRVRNVQIERDHVRLTLAGPDGQSTSLRLHHPEAPEAASARAFSGSFALVDDGPSAPGAAAVERLRAAVQTQDDGAFWTSFGVVAPDRPPSQVAAPRLGPLDGLLALGLYALLLSPWAIVRERRAAAPARPRAPAAFDWLTCLLGLVMLGAVIYASSRASLTAAISEPEGLRWDLRVYYYASQALADGVSPYVHTDLAQFSGRDDLLGCKYPPLTVAAFEPLGRLSFPRASAIYFGVQGLALAALALLWLRLVGPFALVAAAALWPYAARIDLIAGNVSLLEQAIVWSGIAALLAGRRLTFAVLVALSAVCKAQLLAMAALIFVVDPRAGPRISLVAGAAFGGFLWLNALIFPELTASWVDVAVGTALAERGFHAPSLLGALVELPGGAITAALGGLSLLAASVVTLARARRASPLARVLFATVAITLLWPRVKDYSYLALIPAYAHTVMSLWTLRPRGPWLGRGLAALLVLAGAALTAAPDDAASLAGDHRPLLFALLLWLVAGALLWVGAARGETT